MMHSKLLQSATVVSTERACASTGPGLGMLSLLVGGAILSAACSSSAPQETPLGSLAAPIIGGRKATSPSLNFVGALLYRVRSTGAQGVLCTGTLVGPETVLTASHCVAAMPSFERIGVDVSWVTGPNFLQPETETAVVAAERSPISTGGAFGYGSDIGVMHLETPSPIAPARVAAFNPLLRGASMVTLGYGVSSAAGITDGWRRIGRETIEVLEGRIYEAFFGDFESFVEWSMTQSMSPQDVLLNPPDSGTPVDLAALRAEFDEWVLLSGYEIITGKHPGDTQSCLGDSGGPLGLVAADGGFDVYGVVSGGVDSRRADCDYGQLFATLGPESYAFAERARKWTDPCGDVSIRGQCEGDALVTCTTQISRGLRQLERRDCPSVGTHCVQGDTGASCVSIPSVENAADTGP